MNFQKIAENIDVAPVVAALDDHPELWSEITLRQDYPGSAHKDTECIFVRGPKGFTPELYQQDLGSYDYPALGVLQAALVPVLRPLITNTLGVMSLGRVLIVRLAPGGVIDEHIDEGKYADHFTRFHLALTGDEGATLTVGGETQHLAPGSLWWFNHKNLHSGVNDSPKSRIHLIIDAVTTWRPGAPSPYEPGPHSIQVRRRMVDEALPEIAHMFRGHWEEVALNKKVMELQPDIDRYRAMEAEGKLLLLAAYKGDEAVGYSVSFLDYHLHYAGLQTAYNDLLYVDKAHRKGRAGLKLIQETERYAAAAGARLMLWHAKHGTPLNDLLPRLGYGVQDIILSKEL